MGNLWMISTSSNCVSCRGTGEGGVYAGNVYTVVSVNTHEQSLKVNPNIPTPNSSLNYHYGGIPSYLYSCC